MKAKLLSKLRKEANDTYKIRVDGYHTPIFRVVCHVKKESDVVGSFPQMKDAVTTLKHYRSEYMKKRVSDIRYHNILKKYR